MWGWLNSVVDGLKSIWESITSLSESIINGISNFFSDIFETLWDWLKDIWDSITSIPKLIIDGIKEIFIPDTQEIENIVDSMVDNIGSQLGVQFNTLDRLFDREVAPNDVNTDYKINGVGILNLKILDTDFLIQGVAMLRPYIRGFMVLLLVLFNWSQVLSFIDQNPNIAHGAHENYQEWKSKEGK